MVKLSEGDSAYTRQSSGKRPLERKQESESETYIQWEKRDKRCCADRTGTGIITKGILLHPIMNGSCWLRARLRSFIQVSTTKENKASQDSLSMSLNLSLEGYLEWFFLTQNHFHILAKSGQRIWLWVANILIPLQGRTVWNVSKQGHCDNTHIHWNRLF